MIRLNTVLIALFSLFVLFASSACVVCKDDEGGSCDEGEACQCQFEGQDDRSDDDRSEQTPEPEVIEDEDEGVFVNTLDIARGFGDIKGGDRISDLRADQRESVCGEILSYTTNEIRDDEFKELMCTITGIFQAGLSTPEGQDQTPACLETRAQCLENDLDPEQADRSTCETLSDACTATVDEISVCMTQTITVLAELSVATSCETGFDAARLTATPAACNVVKEKCPELFE